MSVSSRPIPALYTVYVLRSTMRHASLYIGSTTDPPRRLKQHNGTIRGGAARTARASLRPWEMVALVSGFPGAVAALKFEWALTNPHLSLHIPSASRLTVSRQTKKNGHPRRPPLSLQSVVANLHLLLRVPSFARWPLRLHVFAPEVHAAWQAWCATAAEGATGPPAGAPAADTLEVVTDFGPRAVKDAGADTAPGADAPPWGIHALPLDYTPLRDYVDKVQDVFTFERADACVVCREALRPGPEKGLYAVCPNTACEAVGHLRCWGQHVLASEANGVAALDGAVLVPKKGTCPSCGGPVVWADMMKELTLRLRAPKEVEKLVKAKRRQEKADTAAERGAGENPGAAVCEVAPASQTVASSTAAAVTTTTNATKTTKTTKAAKTAKTTKTTRSPKAKATKITKTARVTKATSTAAKKAAAKAAAVSASPERDSSPEIIILG